ncbi:MAG: All-trans-phytoene synthase [Candidatus Latescibacteria bacterium ADurb.Bin168]|nr:MAG: All-trans-phytoene synthase [Candidatus Latescibacteria bacterium ADurb.Bin168]
MSSSFSIPRLDDLAGCYRYCREITHLYGANFSVGFRCLPKRKRDAVYAVYAFCRFADDIADEYTGHADRETLLDEWEKGLERCYRGITDHPILVALADAVARFPIPLESFRRLIEGCRMDLVKTRYATFEELLVYCDRVATTIGELSLAIFGWTDPRTPRWGTDLSTALQMTNILRDVAEDARRGRIYVPLEDLARFKCREDDLKSWEPAPGFLQLMEFELERVFHYFDLARPLCGAVSADSRMAVALMGSVYREVALQISRNIHSVLVGKVQLTKVQKAVLVVNAAARTALHRAGVSGPPCW